MLGGRSPNLAILLVILLAVGSFAGPSAPAAKALTKPKAVVIVGPSGTSTQHFLDDGRIMADQAESAGMDVTRIFHPHATWQRVLNHIQGANLVIYMGHGNGWPSPYAPFQERTKDGMGLDGYDGASKYSVTYYGANPIRENIRLARNAIVALVHLCYATGNGEPGMSIPGWSVAKERIDNYASGFIDAGAKSVFGFGWMQKWNFPKALMDTNKTMDELFRTDANGSYPYGWIGWNDRFYDSDRSPGLRIHIDPHPTYGFYRSLVGGFGMTAGEWRGEAGGGGDDGGGDAGGDTTGSAPAITSLSVLSTSGVLAATVNTATTTSGTLPSFHPNGDGLQDTLVVSHTLSESAYLDVRVTNQAGSLVRKSTVWAREGKTTSSWNGKNGSGAYVADGIYTLSYRPRDTAGNVGESRSLKVVVLGAMGFTSASSRIFARDRDDLAAPAAIAISLRQSASISVKVLNADSNVVKTIQPALRFESGDHAFSWAGRDGNGNYVPDGWYSVVVNARTDAGSYSEKRKLWVGAFRVDTSTLTPVRGGRVTFTIYSTESLTGAPTLDVSQSGLSTYTVSPTRVSPGKYRITMTLKSGGTSGRLKLVVNGTDSGGQSQSYATSLPLR